MTDTVTQRDNRAQILLTDTDELICDLIKFNLENEGFSVCVCGDANEALDYDLTEYSLIISETSKIGQLSGLNFVSMIKGNPDTAVVPVIFCSNADSEDDIVNGFNAGADDYILKPFSLREMVARVRAVIRRHDIGRWRPANSQTVLSVGGLTIDFNRQLVSLDGRALNLSRSEFQLLSHFAKNSGKLFKRAQIIELLRPNKETTGSERTIDVMISRLRKKLGTSASMLVNKSGQGYGLIVNE